MKKELKNPSVIAFEKKLSNSDAIMHACNWSSREKSENCVPIRLQHKDIRGTISNRLKSKISSDPLKLDAEIQKPNLQSVDIASLPFEKDTLKLSFTLRVLGDFFIPATCNNSTYQKVLNDKMLDYVNQHGCVELSRRYAENLASGRFLWRNRVGAESLEIKISWIVDQNVIKSWVFNGYDFNLRQFQNEGNSSIKELAEVIQNGLVGNSFAFLKVEAFSRLGFGQEVFPSQELDRSESIGKYKKSKVLYQVGDIAAMHSQKIGNAIRTIDTWHPYVDETGPIAVEPFGSVTNRGSAYRQPKENMDFYTLLDNWILKGKTPETEQQHYVAACFIRGGVFGEENKKGKE